MVKDLDAWHDAAHEPQRVKRDWVTQPQQEECEFFEADTNIAPDWNVEQRASTLLLLYYALQILHFFPTNWKFVTTVSCP